jgi:hypothetical protein
MSRTEQIIGWFLFLTDAVVLICLVYVESYRASEILGDIWVITLRVERAAYV